MEIFKGKVVCPRCDGNGLIFKARIGNSQSLVYICDECDATWKDAETIKLSNFIELAKVLKQNSCTYTDILNLGYDWYNE
ncbi:3'-5' exonuclease [Bacillus sp. FSL R12-0069]|uniref:3'-5' exonuclease n=1 Tax=Bacillus sp. FSL R12-0069 TaxID=2975342 RepID=UPI0030F93DBF